MYSDLGLLMQNFPYFVFKWSLRFLKSLKIRVTSSKHFSNSFSKTLEEVIYGINFSRSEVKDYCLRPVKEISRSDTNCLFKGRQTFYIQLIEHSRKMRIGQR